ncbi:MAG: peptidylprolyl isomerase [Chitinophagaceae bacterium]
MSVIQKIRDKYAKVAGGVIGFSLVAFIVSEGINGSFQNLFGHDTSVAVVDGSKIDTREFSEMSRDYLSLSEFFRKGQKLSEAEQAQLRQQALDQMINEKLIGEQCEKLGIVVTESEEKDMISGPNPDPTIQQYFTTIFQAQQYDPNMVKQFENEVKTKGGEEPKLVELGQQWIALKKFIFKGKLMQKYAAMLANSAYTPKAIQKQENSIADIQTSFKYVKLPFTLIPDAQATVSEAEMKDYMNKHKALFTTDQPIRSLEYVAYEVSPGPDDSAKSLGALQKLKDEFRTTTDNEHFVNRNSDERFREDYVNKKRYMSPMADTILNGAVGSVFGPFYDNGNYKLVKVIDRKSLPDSVKAQHILIAIASQQNPNGLTDTLAHQKADSLVAALKAGANFDSLAKKFSDDPGSKEKGGDLGYFGYGTMVREFNDAAFMGKTGDIKEVKSQFGWHVIKIDDQKDFEPAVELAIVTKALNIGAQADQKQFAAANEFAGHNRTAQAFDAAVKKDGLNVRIGDNVKAGDYVINGLDASREVVRWAYAAKVGDVSDPIHLENKYVVAKLSAISDDGMRALDAATKAQVEALVRNEKKLKMLADKYKTPQSLEALAQQSAQQVQVADSVKGNASFTNALGYEPRVIGYAFYEKFQPGAISPAIEGKDGLFYISLNNRVTLPSTEDPQALQTQAKMQDMQTKNALSQMLDKTLRKNGKVTVNAANIY